MRWLFSSARASVLASSLVGCAASHAPTSEVFRMNATTHASVLPAGAHDFDFLFGRWKVHHRMLKARLEGSQEWIEADGTVTEQPLMGGLGNIEDFAMIRDGQPFFAAALRAFDPQSGEWSIWWLDGRSPRSPLDPPMVGHFENGVGRFYADLTVKDRPVRTRFLWSHEGANEARWEQAYSADGGKTWETNWVMDFTRA